MQKICYTCENDQLYTVEMFRNGHREKTLMERADDSIPLWFQQAGIYSPLPRKITCDPKYNAFKNPTKKWKSHSPPGADYEIRITKKSLHTIGYGKGKKRYPQWMYFWASRERELTQIEPEDAEVTYDGFYNSGLAKADENGDFVFRMFLPTPYLVDGVMYTPHVHLAFLKSNKTWDLNTWTVTVFPYLDHNEYRALKNLGNYVIFDKKSQASKDAVKTAVSKNSHLRHLFGKKYSYFQTPIILKGKHSHQIGDKLLRKGFANLLYYEN